jgi:hypothetical protein
MDTYSMYKSTARPYRTEEQAKAPSPLREYPQHNEPYDERSKERDRIYGNTACMEKGDQ